ncbi:hypothetical protein FTV88_0142 [Heliorestis convoluta]|uniref:Uncharacterized protein n=2 Tax=Heliorestis convoluta TaxID=356322 RepID=A0A5Q2MX30_9FIRM|nr:hypothetical protein FTV88_0142 [Heliorestis convoluta]
MEKANALEDMKPFMSAWSYKSNKNDPYLHINLVDEVDVHKHVTPVLNAFSKKMSTQLG